MISQVVALGLVGMATAQTTYACNPAHQYPEGQTCQEVNGSLTLVTGAATAPAYAASTGFACNPAHQYPNGQTCTEVNGSLTLITAAGTAPAYAAQTSFACNPAHQYPTGQVCSEVNGSLTLITVSASAPAATATAVSDCAKKCNDAYNTCRTAKDANFSFCASQLASCVNYNPFDNSGSFVTPTACSAASSTAPAAAITSAASYACNPAHQYPAGQTCTEVNGALTLITKTGAAAAAPTAAVVPAAGAKNGTAAAGTAAGTAPVAYTGAATRVAGGVFAAAAGLFAFLL